MPAEVVRPFTSTSPSSLRIVPAPIKPMPVMMPWMTREVPSSVHSKSRARQQENGCSDGHEHVRADAGRFAGTLALGADACTEECGCNEANDDRSRSWRSGKPNESSCQRISIVRFAATSGWVKLSLCRKLSLNQIPIYNDSNSNFYR